MRILIYTLMCALIACQTPAPPTPCVPDAMSAPAKATPCVNPAPSGSVTPPTPSPPEPHDACWSAEQKLIALGCKDTRGRLLGGPDLSGLTWSQICRQDLSNGVNLNASCISAASTCAAVEVCK